MGIVKQANRQATVCHSDRDKATSFITKVYDTA
jgi:hypothetical protein